MRLAPLSLVLALTLTAVTAEARETCAGRFHLLRPLPRACLEPIETDRPHLTDTPIPAPPGHLVAEFGLAAFAGGEPRTWQLLEVLAKVGLWTGIDLQVGWGGLGLEDGAAGYQVLASESLYLRTKLQLFGGRHGPLALTVAPVVWVPLRGGVVEGGGQLLLGADLGWELELEFNLGALARAGASGERALHWAQSVALTRALVRRLSIFAEIYGETWREGGLRWIGVVASGLILLLTPNLQLDAGVRAGFTAEAPPYTVFLGAAFQL